MSLAGILGCVVIAINVVVMILGVVILIMGALITWSQSFVYGFIKPLIDNLTTVLSITNSNATGSATASYILNLIQYVGIPVFVLGCIILGIAICGIFGVCCKLRLLLLVYVIFTFLMAVAILLFIVVIYGNDSAIDSFAISELKPLLNNFGDMGNPNNAETVLIIIAQTQLNCCGLIGGSDYNSKNNWPRTETYNGANYTVQYPISCCKFTAGTFNIQDTTCPTTFNSTNSNIMTGCYAKIRAIIQSYSLYGAGVLCAIVILLMILMIISSVIMGESKVGPI